MEVILQPEEVLGIRERSNSTQGSREALIRWKNLPGYEATWEPINMIREQFPEFHLEDKVILLAGGNDTNPDPKWGKVMACSSERRLDLVTSDLCDNIFKVYTSEGVSLRLANSLIDNRK
ncbi:ty3-gypsy retrotransposon protein [Tanacetum coccineum]